MTLDTRTPHLDPAWVDDVVLELRLRDVSGRRIGAALAEADAHCADSGQDVHEAFGDPVQYARSLELPGTPPTPGSLRRPFTVGVCGVFGMLLATRGFSAWRAGAWVDVSWGYIALLAVLVLGMVLLAAIALTQVLEVIVRHPLWFGGAMALHVALGVGLLLLLPGTAMVVPASPGSSPGCCSSRLQC